MTKVAIDIGKLSFDVCIEISGKRKKAVFENSESGWCKLREWLDEQHIQDVHIFFEATGRYGDALATWAIQAGWTVTALNPLRTRRFAEAEGIYNKTDSVDSGCILDFSMSANSKSMRLWRPSSKAVNELKDINLEILGLVKMITQETNRLKAGITSEVTRDCIQRNIHFLKNQKKLLEAEALKVIKEDAKLNHAYKILIGMKGIGDQTATRILARVDFDAFRKGRQLVAFASLAPRKWESGSSVRKKDMISRVGHTDLRCALYLPAIVSMTHDPEMAEFKRQLESRGKPKKVIICAVMARLLRQAFAKVRDSKVENLKAAA